MSGDHDKICTLILGRSSDLVGRVSCENQGAGRDLTRNLFLDETLHRLPAVAEHFLEVGAGIKSLQSARLR